MPDIQMRFHQDMVVLSGSLQSSLIRAGYDAASRLEMLDLFEEEAIDQALRMQMAAGPQCLCTPTYGITRARLAHMRLRDSQDKVVQAALALVKPLRFQHLVAEIGPTLLPLDATSNVSLIANRDEYAQVVRAFGSDALDGFFFNGLVSLEDVRCALMGARAQTTAPVFVSVDVDAQGTLVGRKQSIEEAVAVMVDLGADAVGIRTQAPPDKAAVIVVRMAAVCDLPILATLVVKEAAPRQMTATEDNPYWHPDTMIEAAMQLRAAGAQFLRAEGAATPSYTGALCAACTGLASVR